MCRQKSWLTWFLVVPAVLDPALMAYDAYGLHHAADKPDREGHAISMMGAKDAQVMGFFNGGSTSTFSTALVVADSL
jgi:hypothetical protein